METKKLGFNKDKNKISFLIFIFKTLIILTNIDQNNFSPSFLYSKSITLLNKNIFIIHKSGVDIYYSSLTQKIKNIITLGDYKILNNDTYVEIIISQFNENNFEYIT